jgi:hypothetical protein
VWGMGMYTTWLLLFKNHTSFPFLHTGFVL